MGASFRWLKCYARNDMKHKNRLPPDPVIETYKQHVDRTLLRQNLRLSVEERFLKLMDFNRFAEEIWRAGKEAKRKQ